MIHGTIEKEIRFVLRTLESVESCKNLQGNANHDVLCYVPSLIEIAQNYAILLSETPPPESKLGKLEIDHSLKFCEQCGVALGLERHLDHCAANPMHQFGRNP